ncbi:MAG: MMPL family transporter [Candidatus Bipolaricaulota bacterium]|nr:MMPL family transporter [Candidatus Bipolaricaulota bacterium]
MRRFYEWIADHPYVVIGITLCVTAVFLAFIPRITTDTDFSHYIDPNDPGLVATRRAEDRYGAQSLLMVAIENTQGIFNQATLTKVAEMQAAFAAIDGVDDVTGPLNVQIVTGTETSLWVGPAAPRGTVPATAEEMAAYRDRLLQSNTARGYVVASDEQAAAISIRLKAGTNELAVTEKVASVAKEYNSSPDRVHIIGLSYMNVVLAETMGKDLRILLPLVILAIILVLYLSFRSVRGVLLPLLVVILSTGWSVGLMGAIKVPLTIISFILPVILMAIGVAYGIHVLNRFYEAIDSGLGRRTAVVETGLQMLAPVLMAGLTTVAGFLSLLNSVLVPQRDFGPFAAIGVAVAMVLSLVLIPAFLSLLRPPRQRAHRGESGFVNRVLSVFGWLVLRHRRSVLVVSAILFVAFLSGLSILRIETAETEFLGKESPVVQAMNVLERHFSGSGQLMVEIDTGVRDGLKEPALLSKIVELESYLEAKGVKKTSSLADLVREMNQKFHADDPSYYVIPEDRKLVSQLLALFTFSGGDLGNLTLGDFSAGEVMGLYPVGRSSDQVKLVRDVTAYLKAHFSSPVEAELVGETRISASLHARIARSQISSLATSIAASGAIVALLMASFVAGLISLVPLLLTIAINFGVMAFTGTPLNMATLMVSSMAIGMGIDYAIHFMSRYRREILAGGSAEKALQSTILTTGRGIAFNALSLVLGFILLLASSFKGTRDFGLFVAMTMAISALSAFTVIPAVLITWHPKFLTRTARMRRKERETSTRVE